MAGDHSFYSFEIVKPHPHDAEDITVTVEYDGPLSKQGRREMEFRIDAWCSAVQTCMFADPSELRRPGLRLRS